jgi:hypothetical protein
MDNLDFGDAPVIDMSDQDKQEASRYDSIPNIGQRRKALIYDIIDGKLDQETLKKLPTFIKVIAKSINRVQDPKTGQYLLKIGTTPREREMATKYQKFLATGEGDALASKSMEEVKTIAKEVAQEVLRHIPTENDHPTRKLIGLLKSGVVDDSLNFYLKKAHYDLFGETLKFTVKRLALEYINQFRNADLATKKGNLQESFKSKLKKVYGLNESMQPNKFLGVVEDPMQVDQIKGQQAGDTLVVKAMAQRGEKWEIWMWDFVEMKRTDGWVYLGDAPTKEQASQVAQQAVA